MVEQTWGAPYDPPTTIGGLKSKFGFLSCIKGLENYEMLIDDIDKLLKSTDETIRQQLYAKVLSKLHDDVAFIPLTYTKVTVIAPKNLTNIVFSQSMKEMPFEEFKFKSAFTASVGFSCTFTRLQVSFIFIFLCQEISC